MAFADKYHRRSIRLKDYDYTQNGAYAVTICTFQKECVFGDVDGEGLMRLNDWGKIVVECWNAIPDHFPHVELDAFVVMPNHVHGIVVIHDGNSGSDKSNNAVGARYIVPLHSEPATPHKFGTGTPNSLSSIVGNFKAAVTRQINRVRDTPGVVIWQRNYYEQVIRNERMLNALREYIDANPAHWALDQENPINVRPRFGK